MALQDLAIILSAVSSLLSFLGTLTTGVYAFAVLRTEVNQLKADNKHHWAHQADEGKHFNEKAFNEFERRMDERFVLLEGKVEEVKNYCEDIDSKLDRELRGLS